MGELKGIGPILPNPHLLINPLQWRDAVLLSRIEGTTTGVEQLALFEATPGAMPNQSEAREVLNYVLALEYGLARLPSLSVSLRLICEIHERLMRGVRGHNHWPGEFRRIQTSDGRAGLPAEEQRFLPPPVLEKTEALHVLEFTRLLSLTVAIAGGAVLVVRRLVRGWRRPR